MFHRTAIVEGNFSISEDVYISPYCVIRGEGKIGSGTMIGPGVVIEGEVIIGEKCRIGAYTVLEGSVSVGGFTNIGAHCCIGSPPQYADQRSSSGGVRIGSGNVIREFTSIHAPSEQRETVLENNCYIMAYSHIAHDCRVSSNVKMANNSTLAGFVIVGEYSYLGLHSVVHQNVRIGAGCMIGMNSIVLRHVVPFSTFFGGLVRGVNVRGLNDRGFPESEIKGLTALFGGEPNSTEGVCIEAVRQFLSGSGNEARYFLPFERTSTEKQIEPRMQKEKNP
jgi:UDP-N-acetylglucosamine acyltransferase